MSRLPGRFALVLHAHLPWVAPTEPMSFEEAWVYEALLGTYLPLLGVLDRAGERGANHAVLTFLMSPTLIALLKDPSIPARFEGYLSALLESSDDAFTRTRALEARRTFEAIGGDVVEAFVAHAERGTIDLGTTALSHAYLPNVLSPAARRMQLRMGARYFRLLTRRSPRAFWLPECGTDPKLGADLADAEIPLTFVDEHAFSLADNPPLSGLNLPMQDGGGVAYFARDRALSNRVWSRDHGYPKRPEYREFHRSKGNADPIQLAIKPYRIDGLPYDPVVARASAERDADDFAREVTARLELGRAELSGRGFGESEPIVVTAFDAELFGHWWLEGPWFLERLLERLGQAPSRLTSPADYLRTDPVLPVGVPAASSWGEGGFGRVWTNERTAFLTRVMHRAERRMLAVDALVRDTQRTEVQRRARVRALREFAMLQASDFSFMVYSGECAEFAQRAVKGHAESLEKLLLLAERPRELPGDAAALAELERRALPFAELHEDEWADAFDPW